MRLLLDEQVPRRLKRSFAGHNVQTVRDMGWNGKSNGELLELARDEFDAFITLDRILEYQLAKISVDVGLSGTGRFYVPGRPHEGKRICQC